MSWKLIGQAVVGSSHLSSDRPCEDALHAEKLLHPNGTEILICCASDGAGSARFAATASQLVVTETVNRFAALLQVDAIIEEADIYQVAEEIYELLRQQSVENQVAIQEYSCTWLGAVLFPDRAVFFQIGDGAIVRHNGVDGYVTLWPPENGEYQNSTWFLVDHLHMAQLRCIVLHERIDEIALLTDGLQMLALNIETNIVHQPFFESMFKWLRLADNDEKIATLNNKLQNYLGSELINQKTDDDKTLLLATRLNS
ncbi:MAG: PP2C family serine/threonine-protein phosphatase [Chitinophagaceae bacterium]